MAMHRPGGRYATRLWGSSSDWVVAVVVLSGQAGAQVKQLDLERLPSSSIRPFRPFPQLRAMCRRRTCRRGRASR